MKKELSLIVLLSFVLVMAVAHSMSLVQSSPSQTVRFDQQDPPVQHGPFEGKKKCYNKGKEANCECQRECYNGTPGKDAKCKNYCYEDACLCATKCQS